MKLDTEHKAFVLRALGGLSLRAKEEDATKILALIDKIMKGDMHVVPEGHVDKLAGLVKHLNDLHEQSRVTVQTYITTVQKRCPHRFNKPNPDPRHWRPIKTDSCQICGLVRTPAPKLTED